MAVGEQAIGTGDNPHPSVRRRSFSSILPSALRHEQGSTCRVPDPEASDLPVDPNCDLPEQRIHTEHKWPPRHHNRRLQGKGNLDGQNHKMWEKIRQ